MSTPTTPAIPSSDAAAAAWDASAPAKTEPTPVTPPAAAPSTPATPSTPAAAATPPADAPVAAGDLEGLTDLLGDDLKAPVAAAPPAVDPNDPLAALKDNPRVQELVAAETAVKGFIEASDYIKGATDKNAAIANAIADADVLWKISEGKANVSEILIAAKAADPATFQKILGDFKAFYEQETGQQLAAAAAGVQQTPEQKRIATLEKEAADRKTAEVQAQTTKRIGEARTKVLESINTSLKGTWLDGEGERLLTVIGAQLGADSTMKIVEAAEKGDFSQVNKALLAARNQEATLFKARIDRMIAAKKAKQATIPTQVTGGTTPASTTEPETSLVEMDPEKRRAKMLASYQSS
jgi:hypothetical protein